MFDRRRLTLVASVALLVSASAMAEVKLPTLFQSNMVLQRDMFVPVWGWAAAGERVTVSFGGRQEGVVAGARGDWMVRLSPMPASAQPRDLVIKGSNTLTLRNILVGEVWICSGQSNMEWSVNGAKNSKQEAAAAKYPQIRHIKVQKRPSDSREKNFNGTWQVCEPRSVGGFTAVGYYFGRELHRKLKVPIGLINSSWGGTRIEPWTNLEGFKRVAPEFRDLAKIVDRIESSDPKSQAGKDKYRAALDEYRKWLDVAEEAVTGGRRPPSPPSLPSLGRSHQDPTRLYRGMISPLVPFAVRGAIWYQGESNGNEHKSYYYKKHALVKGWREVWGQPEFHFYWVQLANFRGDNKQPAGGDGYARVREAQTMALDIPNSGMAVIIDIGEARDIHPRNKQDVGKRLAKWAFAGPYKMNVVPSGPLYASHSVEGNRIRVSFKYVGGGLMVGKKNGLEPTVEDNGAKLQRFAIAGADKKWVWADAVIDGDTVVVSSPKVAKPVAVRYAYSGNPEGRNLYNREGLPAGPFRTDKW